MKEKILKCLRETEDYVSGQELCRMLDVSRTAIWKVMNQLKDEGYVIDAVKNKGYKLIQTPDIVTAEEVDSLLETEWAGHPVVYEEEQESTNQTAKMLAEQGAFHGTLVVAERQVSGRGRRGRPWHSPKGSGIWMSILLRPQIHPMSASMLTLVAAMAVYDAISSRVEGCAIKWPNDIVINGRKVCGILTEGISDFETGQIEHLILGIGINTTVKDFPAELLATAGAAEGTYSKSALAAETITQALGYIEDLDSASFLPAYKEKSLVIGKTVTVYQGRYKVNPEDEITGVPARVLDIADDGGLIVLYADGHQEKLVSGEISIRI